MSSDRDFGDEPQPVWRDQPPDVFTPIDPNAPVSGHRPPPEAGPRTPPSQAPEHDWLAAEAILMPVLRPVGTSGTRLSDIDPAGLAAAGLKSHSMPILDDGPSGLAVGYVLRAGGFDAHIDADHLLAWGASPAEMRAAAMANLGRWSATAPWAEEASGVRRIVSSASGEGGDAERILLPEVRAHLARELGAPARVLVGMPERDLLVAAGLTAGDEEFAALFAEFVRGHADGSDLPLDRRVHELVDGELRLFEA